MSVGCLYLCLSLSLCLSAWRAMISVRCWVSVPTSSVHIWSMKQWVSLFLFQSVAVSVFLSVAFSLCPSVSLPLFVSLYICLCVCLQGGTWLLYPAGFRCGCHLSVPGLWDNECTAQTEQARTSIGWCWDILKLYHSCGQWHCQGHGQDGHQHTA